jgi:hypothetical protein
VRGGLAALLLLVACQGPPGLPDPVQVELERRYRSLDLDGCAIASPVAAVSQDEPVVLLAMSDGVVVALSPDDGHEVFRVVIPPAAAGQEVHLAATPALVDGGHRLLVASMHRLAGTDDRREHRVHVIELEARALDPAFPALTLTAAVKTPTGTVDFLPAHAYSRSALVVATPPDRTLGLGYVSFGNIRDIQPWHGWVFEVDLDAWAISSVLLTTPEADCGPAGKSGSDEMICGGGVWAPPGPTLHTFDDGSYELYVATGNGQLDLGRQDYANAVLRTGRGLGFTPGCDASCDAFDPIDPAPACMSSCEDLFIPRLTDGDPPFDPPDGRCDGKTFFECYALLDWDLGANSVARIAVPGGDDVIVVPAKDGGIYLVDAEHLGTLHDRLQLTDICGGTGSPCTANWAGTMVTVPVSTTVDGVVTVLVPTFVFDATTPAGIVALDVVRDGSGTPRWRPRWQAPVFGSGESTARFREHTGRLALVTIGGVAHAALVDPGNERSHDGLLYVVRVADGTIVERAPLDGPGRKYTLPLVDDDTLHVVSCDAEVGPSHLEGWQVTR